MFAVVEFTETAEVAVAASNWLKGKKGDRASCFWPPHNYKASKACQQCTSPDKNTWAKYGVVVIAETGEYMCNNKFP